MTSGPMSSRVEVVQEIYAAFGRGDIPAILARLHPDVQWEYGTPPSEVPWLRPRQGREEVAGFLESLGNLEFRGFNPKTFLEGPELVAVLLDVNLVVKATGKPIVDEEIHLWHFDAAESVVRFRHVVDTLQHYRAFRG